jgi:pimeloyl-ACP methyl ester carboxylesterase
MSIFAPAVFADTFVLVHGALLTSGSWSLVESALLEAGHQAVSFNVPGRGGDGLAPSQVDLGTAVAKLDKVIRSIPGRVFLVGHSQGGALITQVTASSGHKIKGLVYVSALVPQNGETAFDGLTAKTQENFGKTVKPDVAAKLFRLNDDHYVLEKAFFQDLREKDSHLADRTLASMVDEPMGIGTMPLHFPQNLYDAMPKFYVETTLDNVVDIENQRNYQNKVCFSKIFTLKTSHSPFLTMPKELASILIKASASVH